MRDPSTFEPDPLPMRFLLSPPLSIDEAVARGTVATGRLISQCWSQQRLLESCAVRLQACLFGTAEQMWRHALEACYLQAPRRSEQIPLE